MAYFHATNHTHRPCHFYQDGQVYFLTGGTYKKQMFLNTNEKKQYFTEIFFSLASQYNYDVLAFIVLDNHYHCIIQFDSAQHLKDFVRKLHSITAIYINKQDGVSGRKVWYQYWDRCVRDENEFLNTLNYIFWNPVKHGASANDRDYKHLRIAHVDLVDKSKPCDLNQFERLDCF